MAEDIKEDENSSEDKEISNGLIPEDNEDTNSAEETSNSNETDNSNESTQTPIQEDNQIQENIQEEIDITEDETNPVQKKQTKLQKILIIVVGVLGGILLIGFVLYFFGVFDPEEKPKPEMTTESMEMNQTKEPEKYIFDSKDINIDRLNGKLRILTKYEIIGTQEEERQKELEKNSKLSTAQINKLLNSEQDKEEEKKKKEEEEKQKKLKEEAAKKAKAQNPYDLLKFIQVAANDSLLSSIDNETQSFKVKTARCEDNNRQFFLIGPFKSNKELNQAFRIIYDNITPSATKKDLARLEFNRICKQ